MVKLTVAVTAEIINWVRQTSLAMFFQFVRFRGVVAIMAGELPTTITILDRYNYWISVLQLPLQISCRYSSFQIGFLSGKNRPKIFKVGIWATRFENTGVLAMQTNYRAGLRCQAASGSVP